MINKLPFLWYFSSKLNDITHNDSLEKKNVFLLGQGWLYKGFVDNIDHKRTNIINIYKDDFSNTPLILDKMKNPSNKNNFQTHPSITYIKDNIKHIDLENQTIVTEKNTFNIHEPTTKQHTVGDGAMMMLYKHNKNTHGFTGTSPPITVIGLGGNKPVTNWQSNVKNIMEKYDNGKRNFAIVGAGILGTELAFHLKDKDCKVTIYEALSSSHDYLGPRLKSYIIDRLKNNNIDLFINQKYNNKNDELYDDTIFAIGSKANDLTLDFTQTVTLKTLDNKLLYPNVYIGGDCVHNSNLINLSRDAQTAYDQGKHIAININNGTDDIYTEKSYLYAIYVGNDMHAIYNPKLDMYILLPSIFVKLYHNLF